MTQKRCSSRRNFLRSGIATGLAGVRERQGRRTTTDGERDETAGATATDVELLILSDEGLEDTHARDGRTLTTGRYETSSSEFRVGPRYTVERDDATIVSFAAAGDRSVVTEFSPETGTRLVVLDADLERRDAREHDGTPAIAATDDRIYAASETEFTVFDDELTELGTARLPPGLQGKDMEDLVIHGDSAYIVDDVMEPLYLLRVDITDPSKPRYAEAVEILEVNQTLGEQWIVPERNLWMVVQRTSTRTGQTENVLITAMEGGGAGSGRVSYRSQYAVDSEEIYAEPRTTPGDGGPDSPGPTSPTGLRIDDVTAKPPVYASVTTADGDHYLSSVTVTSGSGTRVRFGTEIPTTSPAQVTRAETAVVALSRDDPPTLTVVDPERGTTSETRLEIDDPRDIAAAPGLPAPSPSVG